MNSFGALSLPMSEPNQAGFDLPWMLSQLAGTQFSGSVHHLPTVGSTNALAAEAAQRGARSGVWIADEQTAGRGRGGHRWHSAAGDGLYLSVLLRPRLAGVDVLKLSLTAGLAAWAAVLEIGGSVGARMDLRWPNDLMLWGVDGVERKFGGILTESVMEAGSGTLAHAVIGIGMNLNHSAMPEELRATATSLRMEGADEVRREPLVVALLLALESGTMALEREASGGLFPGELSLAARFGQASTWVEGLEVEVAEDDGYTGVTAGLNEQGLLEVRLRDGSRRSVRHGGVRRLRVR